jgi:uncharacterized protein with PQ loop repeat
MQEILGLLGSLCFAISSWPQVYVCLRTKTASGISWGFILLWLSGAFFSSIYAIAYAKYILLINFVFCAIGTLIICGIKAKELSKIRGKK